MVHEKTVSGLYSPVKLGEVISVRHFTPSGQVNPWNRSENDRIEKLTFENGQFVRQPKATPEPQRLLTVIDAFESIKWAMIFARWGKEPDVVRFCEFFINMVRDNPNKIPQVREYYKKCSWDLAMHMRSEHTFESGLDRILQSPDKHDALARWLPPDGPGKGKGKKGQGKGRETHPYGGKGKWRTPSAPTTAPQGTPDNQCRLWAQGFCKFGDKCKFVHAPARHCRSQQDLLHSVRDSSDRLGPRTGRHPCKAPGNTAFLLCHPLTRVSPRSLNPQRSCQTCPAQ